MDQDGAIRVGNTRVLLDLVVHQYDNGAAPEKIVRAYESLDLADVHAAIAYYLRHRDEVQAYLRQREEEAGKLRQLIEANQAVGPSKEELLRRWAERNKNHAPPAR
jgi:uncharacterized protein (DUF433 family)